MSDNVERCVLEGYRGVWVRETDYDALRTRIDRAMKVYHDWHTDPTEDSNGVLVKIATILEGGEDGE